MYTIREATVNDVETIRLLAHEIWWPTYSPILAADQIDFMLADRYSTAAITDQLQQGTQTYLLLLANGQPVAFAGCAADDEDAVVYKLHKIYSLPATRGQGAGKMLLNAVTDRARAAGKRFLELNVHRSNPAKGFYEKLGFTIIAEVDIPFGPYFLNDYVMRKAL